MPHHTFPATPAITGSRNSPTRTRHKPGSAATRRDRGQLYGGGVQLPLREGPTRVDMERSASSVERFIPKEIDVTMPVVESSATFDENLHEHINHDLADIVGRESDTS
jgi:hypothetical protein